MTLRELYQNIGADYDQALRVLRVEKLVDKHIRKFVNNGVVSQLLEAGAQMESARMFEAAHAAKGVCGNLGLTALSDMASQLAEEYRPGNARHMSDEDVKAVLQRIETVHDAMAEGIRQYIEG
ncbi:MAG: Hpt domain-containing protein [Clostridia bacterium]|nr:Hpt domain-containing protein [Clostridia bacterium]